MRAGAVRWAAEPAAVPGAGLHVETKPGQAGETCVSLHAQKGPALVTRCTYGIVWTGSARPSPNEQRWRWRCSRWHPGASCGCSRSAAPDGMWTCCHVPLPSIPMLKLCGVCLGWVPGADKMLVAREARVEGKYKRSFELLSMETLNIDAWADRPDAVRLFSRWQDPAWRRQTLSLR
ncbi:hypothetical protein LP419_13815 [Massilia sp. H-1]|nr:hypothetical protein LP419_13815 [Massilia sp. H-1]